MKTIIPIILLLLFIGGCEKKQSIKPVSELNKKNEFEQLINKLEKKGFYRYTAKENIEKAKKTAIDSKYMFGWELCKRDYHADSEDLTEAGVIEFIQQLKPFLEKQGVKIKSIKHNYPDDEAFEGLSEKEELKLIPKTYIVTVNGKDFTIWTQKEVDNKKLDVWQLSTERTLDIINYLLKEAGSKERAYQLYYGNDARIIFLTPEMARIIDESKCIDRKDKPIIKNIL